MRDGVLRWDVWLGILLGLAFAFGVPAAVNPHFETPEANSGTREVSELVEEEQKIDINNAWIVGIVTSVIGALIIAALGQLFVIPKVIAQARAKGRDEHLLDDLAELRGEGIQIRNSRLQPLSQAEQDIWIERAESWKERMYAKVAEKSSSDSKILRDLDTFPEVTVQGVTDDEHLRKLGDLTETIRRLRELADTYR